VREVKKSTISDRWPAVRPRPEIAACCLRIKGPRRRGLAPTKSLLTRCRPAAASNSNSNIAAGRSIMADQPNNQGERMDERSGNNGAGGGSIGSSGNRNDSGADSRNTSSVSRKTPRGFAAMDPQAQRAIAAKGGRAAHQKGTAHEFTSEEARVAGRKGGEASRGGRRSTSGSNT
jgi:general stress protein YciG